MKFSLSVKARIFSTIALLAVAVAAVGAIGYRSTSATNAAMRASYEDYFLAESWLAEMVSRQRENLEQTLVALVGHDADVTKAARSAILQNRQRIDGLWTQYETTVHKGDERALADEFKPQRAKLLAVMDATLDTLAAGNYEKSTQLVQQELMVANDLVAATGDKLLAYQVKIGGEMKADAERDFTSARLLLELSIFGGIAGAVLLGWMLARSMLTSLHRAVQVSERIAAGELGHRIEISTDDEFGQLLRSLQSMDAKLVEIVGQVRASADSVGTAAREISQGNDDLSSRTQQQASALEETAASMEEMTATVKQNADNAQQANQLSAGARNQADLGGAVVARAVSAMTEINTSSRRIADIIGVIDELAFQTNLLALNAAVEAARAGEQGRGFAVVASEVRNLAQRSAAAAKEIKDLIQDSVDKVKTGSDLVDQSGKTLTEIIEGIKKVTDVVAEISAASQEQSSGIDQVNNAVTQMDQTTQQNAALVEEAAAASKAMEQQAQELLQQVGFFRIGNEAVAQPVAVSISKPRGIHKPVLVRPISRIKRAPVARATPLARASGDDSSWEQF